MPRGLCKPAQDAWESFWDDPISSMSRGPDTVVAVRWVKNLDRYWRLSAAADAEPIVKGSTGQTRSNPVYDLALKIEASIREDEKQLGIGALSRLRLGAVYGEGAKTLADLNAEAEDAAADEGDFRLLLLAGKKDEPIEAEGAE